MRISLTTLLNIRRVVLAFLTAIDAMLLEGYNWTPRGSMQKIDESYTMNDDATVVRG